MGAAAVAQSSEDIAVLSLEAGRTRFARSSILSSRKLVTQPSYPPNLVTQELGVFVREINSHSERDKNVIVQCSKRVESSQNASERVSGKRLKNQIG
jgi:hypothetical protein